MSPIITDLKKYIAAIDFPLQVAATVYPLNGDQVLLGKKIKVGGLGEGYYLGIGGKPEPEDKDIEDTARREVLEEITVSIGPLTNMGTAFFYFPFKENRTKWNMQVHLFTCQSSQWTGAPKITNEMDPKWFDLTKVPYDQMWDDNKLFLPHLLKGKRIETHIMYGEDNLTVADYSLKFLDNPARL